MTSQAATVTGGGGNQNKNRRRRQPPPVPTNDARSRKSLTSNDKKDGGCYDDDDGYSDDEKGHHRSSQGFERNIYGGSLSFGKVVLNPCLNLFQSTLSFYRRRRLRQRPSATMGGTGTCTITSCDASSHDSTVWLLAGLLLATLVLAVVTSVTSPLDSSQAFYWRHRLRPITDAHVNQISIRIRSLDHDKTDIGGWMFLRRFFRPTTPLDLGDSLVPDYGTLSLTFSSTESWKAREIPADDANRAEIYWRVQRKEQDGHRSSYTEPAEDLEDRTTTCVRPSFKLKYYPNCNAAHEVALYRSYNPERAADHHLGYDGFFDTYLISHGYFRDVWVLHQPDVDVKSILKVSRWKHDFKISNYINVLNDATVMERLTKSPRIIDIYGHCGTTVLVEPMPFEVEEYVVPGDGYILDPKDLHDEEDVDPKNHYTVEEKLEMALTMAESLADLHGYSEGVIVHDDVQVCQWLATKNKKLKLGDFNRAEVMEYDPTAGQYCKYNNGDCYGNYRAPEEFAALDLNEKIDVFSFGNNIYALLTGLWVFYDNKNDDEVHKLLIGKNLPYIDPRWRTRSYIEGKLVEIMEKCWEYDPDKRIDIFEAVRLLRDVLKESKRRKAEEK